ncbi:MAG: zinc ABC transporter substrate-binding protein [Thermodesulfobacteriota bacterium]|nr:zinc ABC transporter substrate-binding protein [Thermodesulfobacteriota bacterium]
MLILYILHPVSAFSADKLTVFVSILPQKYFVQQIGKDFVDVHVMVLPGASPATYEPKPRQMTTLSRADIYFSIGVPFEKAWLQKIVAATPEMKLIPIDRGIKKISMMPVHEDEKKDHHDHGALDPHIWLSPPLVKKQARTILEALIEVDPDKALEYQSNYDVFIFEIDRLDMELKNIFADRQGLKFMVFHPSWGYFARTYGLMQVPIEIEGKDPKPAQLKKLIETARAQHIKVVFVQPQFSSRSARQIAREIGGQVVTADSLALNWSENLEEVAGKIKAVLNLK